MLINTRRVIIAGAVTAVVSLVLILVTTVRNFAWIGALAGGLIIGLRAEDRIDALCNGTGAGVFGGLLLAALVFTMSTVSVLSILRPLNALHYGTSAALPGLLLYPFLFAVIAVVTALLGGPLLRRTPISTALD